MKQKIKTTVEKYCQNEANSHHLIWEHLKDGKFLNKKFQRCHPIFFDHQGEKKFLLADFYCPAHNLIIELDQGIHSLQPEYKINRRILLEHFDYRFIRFPENKILRSFDDIMLQLGKTLIELHLKKIKTRSSNANH